MDRPTQVKIGPDIYDIMFVNDVDIGEEGVWGNIRNRTKIIKVALQIKRNVGRTLLHEILHGIEFTYGIEYGKSDNDEHVVDLLTVGLAMLVQDNPDLWAWIQQEIVAQIC